MYRTMHVVHFAPLLLGVAACHSDSAGLGRPGIEIVAGGGGIDTANAYLPQTLRVVVRDQRGAVMPGAVVVFAALRTVSSDGRNSGPSLLLSRPSSTSYDQVIADTTDGGGNAAARIRLYTIAGPAAVEISVPIAGLADTAHYSVIPGSPDTIVFTPNDVAVTVGKSYVLSPLVLDASGNPRSADIISYRSSVAAVAVTSQGQISASSPARAAIVASISGSRVRAETVWVSAVPHGVFAMYNGALDTTQFDGSGYTALSLSSPASPSDVEWKPDGSGLLVSLSSTIYSVSTTGALTPIVPAVPTVAGAPFAISSLGSTIYFIGGGGACSDLYRYVVGSGNSAEDLTPRIGGSCQQNIDQSALTVSPDGTQLIFVSDSAGYAPSLQRMDLATKTITSLHLNGRNPQYSPLGDLIAYEYDYGLWVAKPDGSASRAVTPTSRTGNWYSNPSWSSDGKWLAALVYSDRHMIELVNVQTDEELPLMWTYSLGAVGAPKWKPGP